MKPRNWLSMLGTFEIADNGLTFKGGVAERPEGQAGLQIGNFISDQTFGGGVITTTVTFSDEPLSSAAGIILYYHAASRGFVEVQIGGPSLASVYTFAEQWTLHASSGSNQQLERGRPYRFQARVTGSRVVVTIDGIQVVDTNLRFALPRGQCGIWASGPHDILFADYDVEAEHEKLFVVMQFTDPFNELYADVIQPVGQAAGFVVVRADDAYGPGIIVADIERQIIEAKAIIADITPANPNVYWEVGYAHALRKPTILVAQRGTALPFDVSPFRTIFYDNTIAGKARIVDDLRRHLGAIQSEWLAG